MEICGVVPSPQTFSVSLPRRTHSPGLRSPVHDCANLHSMGGLCLQEPRPQAVYRLLPLRIGPDSQGGFVLGNRLRQ